MVDNYELYFHGSVPFRGSQMTVGAVLVLNGKVLDELGGTVPYSGNENRAQWEALVQGMNLASSHSRGV